MRAIRLILENGPDTYKAFWESRMQQLKKKVFRCKRATEDSEKSLSNGQKAAQGKINLPLPAHMLNELGMGGQLWVKQFTDGFPVVGEIPEPGEWPGQQRDDP